MTTAPKKSVPTAVTVETPDAANLSKGNRDMDSTTPASQGHKSTATMFQLRNAVNMMDCLSNGGFSEISAIANLALAWLETPRGQMHIEVIADALSAIRDRADDIQNCIGCEAESVGCSYVDTHRARRYAAQRAHREKETAEEASAVKPSPAPKQAQKREEVAEVL